MSDRRLWLVEPCPTCGARSGLRCQTSRYGGKPTRFLHAARGWRHRPCPTCKAQPGQLCKTPTGRRASQPHTARLHRGRRELFAEEQVWEELERWEAAVALVRFSGGGGNQGSIAAVTLEDAKKCELARWGSGEGELPEALAAPIWGRYALFRGHPRISGLLMWDVQERQVVIAGERGGQKFEELVSAPRQLYRPAVTPVAVDYGATRRGDPLPGRGATRRAAPALGTRACASAAASRSRRGCARRRATAPSGAGRPPRAQRLKDRPPSPPPSPPETCSWCGGPMPAGVRVEARFCSKRCRQASSRHALRVRRSSPKTSGPHDSPRPRGAKAQG